MAGKFEFSNINPKFCMSIMNLVITRMSDVNVVESLLAPDNDRLRFESLGSITNSLLRAAHLMQPQEGSHLS